jgi:23S rRNA-/tRNA-specific pseudouridylate synthase
MKINFLLKPKVISDYFIQDGLRFVKPYIHNFTSRTKKEWVDKDILTIFSNEFSLPKEYCNKLFEKNRIFLNDKIAFKDQIIKKENQLLKYVDKNRLEAPAIHFEDLEIIYDSPTMVVINKPPSYPVNQFFKE